MEIVNIPILIGELRYNNSLLDKKADKLDINIIYFICFFIKVIDADKTKEQKVLNESTQMMVIRIIQLRYGEDISCLRV